MTAVEDHLEPKARPESWHGWVRRRFFATPVDAALSLLVLFIVARVVPPVLDWMVFDATWSGSSSSDCTKGGACWAFVRDRFMQFIYGFYPADARWRPNLTFLILTALGVALVWLKGRGRLAAIGLLFTLMPAIGFILLYGGWFGLPVVTTDKWGGLMLTLVISVVGIACSLPLGMVLALGRRSKMPIVSKLSIGFIEFWRGVPLVTVLFMASVMLPLFLPAGVTFDKLMRALVGVTLFAAAYMAEVIRGGLQAIPKGQYEAASALGLGYWRSMGLIILPQAMRKVIPGVVNTFIGLFKDTTLVLIIGMFDLLGIVQAAATDPLWLGHALEGYVFAGLVFWVFCFAMSRFSARIERRLNQA